MENGLEVPGVGTRATDRVPFDAHERGTVHVSPVADRVPSTWRLDLQAYPGAAEESWSGPGFQLLVVGQADTAGVPTVELEDPDGPEEPDGMDSRSVSDHVAGVAGGSPTRTAEKASGPEKPLLTWIWSDGVPEGAVTGPTEASFHHPLSTVGPAAAKADAGIASTARAAAKGARPARRTRRMSLTRRRPVSGWRRPSWPSTSSQSPGRSPPVRGGAVEPARPRRTAG
jgi:hypothetical protein